MNELRIETPSDREIRLIRDFAAPPDLVFAAHTTPALLRRWYGRPGWELTVCEIDLRPGGKWRYVNRQPSGREVGQYGVYLEVVPSSRLVNTEAWEDWNPGEVVVTHAFEANGSGTTLTLNMLFPTREVRDTLIEHGMNDGTAIAYRQLDQVLEELSAGHA